jgi:hypothetical protein
VATIRITEADLVRDASAALARVRRGDEVIIEEDHREIAVLKRPKPVGRLTSEVIAELKARGSTAAMDEDFARDIEEGLKAQRQPWKPPSWD